jgi:HEAT repeat protein
VRFARELPDDSPYAAREASNGEDARQLARELLGMTQPEFSAAFEGSPMKRAKLRGLKRNAAIALGNVGNEEDIDVLARALDDEEPLRSVATCLAQNGTPGEAATPAPSRHHSAIGCAYWRGSGLSAVV